MEKYKRIYIYPDENVDNRFISSLTCKAIFVFFHIYIYFLCVCVCGGRYRETDIKKWVDREIPRIRETGRELE